MNADEAVKCLNMAKRAINERLFVKAEKWLTKSIKLHETNEAQTLLQRLDLIRASAKANPPVVKRTPIPEPPPKVFTPEEAKIADDILKSKDYYDILGVAKDISNAQLKRAYKKKCLKVHPDKNNAPNADEAFKRVNAAMTCLSDAKKRRQYNQLGSADKFENRES